ncbi:MAG: phytochelatin synthase family protein, partial [Myxococcales bacterium]|nr:phytochelatin synthase family protein [Myxococcales bacterium]
PGGISMDPTRYRRDLPAELIAFGSPEGRRLLVQSLEAGTAEAFYPLVSHLHTQAEPAWCGLGTLVTVLNALEIDPGRAWKGPWRFFGEQLLLCCEALELAVSEGLTLSEVGCLAACNGAGVRQTHAEPAAEPAFRTDLLSSVRAPRGPFLVANYSRSVLGQTGSGHFSPLAAVHAERDMVLVLDVARFKYPPHWVDIGQLYRAMVARDPQSETHRGWLELGAHGGSFPPPGAAALRKRLLSLGAVCPGLPGPGSEAT